MTSQHIAPFLAALSSAGFDHIYLNGTSPEAEFQKLLQYDRLQHNTTAFEYVFQVADQREDLHPEYNFVVFFHQGLPIALMEWVYASSRRPGDICDLGLFEVLSEHQGKGYGKTIMRAFCGNYVIRNRSQLQFDSTEDAVPFYKRVFDQIPGIKYTVGVYTGTFSVAPV